MELKDLLLKKEELPILRETSFFIPIHPTLLNPDIRLDSTIAKKVFPEAANDWYEDLRKYAESLEDESTRRWIEEVFLKQKPEVETEYSRQRVKSLYWEDQTESDPNGFVRVFSISRDGGGSLYFNEGEIDSREFVSFEREIKLIKFPRNKLIEFGKPYSLGDVEGVVLNVYSQHNVDHFPGALFLRNWAILYMNEALKQIK